MEASRRELTKEEAMAVHTRGFKALQGCGLPVAKFSVREPVPPSAPLQGLRPISLSELKVGKVHHGRVLMGTFCADAFRMTAIATVLQDEKDPSLAARVAIYNAASSSSSTASVQKLYPKNIRVAIKEPYFKRAADGLLVIRVDNPANVEKVLCVDAKQKQSDAHSSAHQRNVRGHHSKGVAGPLQLKEEGNGFFGKQDWKSAIDCYTKCISMIVQNDAEQEANAGILLVAYSNRAEAWMRLGSHTEALQDSESALAIDSKHTKSQFRKGRALHGLKRFQEAELCLQDLLLHHPDLSDVHTLLDTVKKGSGNVSEKFMGLADFLLHRKSIPKFSDYVGPVVVRQTEDGRGRGLFATARVKPGDLLLASNALAFSVREVKALQVHQDSTSETDKVVLACQEDLVSELVRRGTESPSFLHQIYNLASFSGVGMDVPSMDFFMNAANTVEHDSNLQVDVARIRKIVKINGFNQEPMSREHCCAGIWLLPSFINHSCIPNASRFHAGKGLVIHAAAEIQAGEEITFTYFNPTFPLEHRKTRAQAWDFWCLCKRCQFEKTAEKHLQNLNKDFDHGFNEARKEYVLALRHSMDFNANAHLMAACRELSKIYKKITKRVSSLDIWTSVEKKWILTSYSSAFCAEWYRSWGNQNPSFFRDSFGMAVEVMEALRASVPGCPWNWSFIIKLAFLAAFGNGDGKVHAAYLKEQATDECIRAFGKLDTKEITQLMEKDLDAIPSIFVT